MDRYVPPQHFLWKGRCDGGDSKRFHEIVQCIDLRENSLDSAFSGFGILGFSCDEGIRRNQGRPGACEGPDSFRKSLAKHPFNPLRRQSVFDIGNISCMDERLSLSQEALGAVIGRMLDRKILPIAIGGGHEIAWGTYQGIRRAYPDNTIAVVNFDAHFDLRPLLDNDQGTSGTSFTQIANDAERRNTPFNYTCIGIQRYGNTKQLFDRAEKLKANFVFADDIHLKGWKSAAVAINRAIDSSELVYVTICLDVFSASTAPGVSAPQPLGLYPWQLIPLLRQLAQSKKTICLDIAELSPVHDTNGMTSDLAASLVCDFIHHYEQRDFI